MLNADRPSQEQINETYKQAKLAIRIRALEFAAPLIRTNSSDHTEAAKKLVECAAIIEEYAMKEIIAPTVSPITRPHGFSS